MRPEDQQPTNGAPSQPRRRRGVTRTRIIFGAVFAALVIAVLSLRALSVFITDFMWFNSLDFSGVWWSVLWARIGLGLLFTAIAFVVIWINLYLAERLSPSRRPAGPQEEFLKRWHETVGKRRGWLRLGVSVLLGLLVGAGVSGRWQEWLFFVNPVDFGFADEQFGRDAGFYVFRLPFLEFLVGWAFAAVLVSFIFAAIWHYLHGGISIQGRSNGSSVTPQVKAHLSLLLGLLALIKAVGYFFDQFSLTLSTRGVVDGATYTDVNAQLPVLRLMIIISVFSFLLLVVNIWRRGFTYPVIAVGLWAVIAVLAGALYPALVQRFQVEPSESSREAVYIERNIAATRTAMALDRVTLREFNYEPELSAQEIVDNLATVRNVRLLDPSITQDTFQQTQGIRSFYDFTDIDVDRYIIDGQPTQIVLSARELRATELPSTTWETTRVSYTHGYGIAAAPANAVDTNGRPAYVLGDIPAVAEPGAEALALTQPGLYVGEGLTGYAVVGANRNEVDFLDDDDVRADTRYDGEDGVGIGSLVRRSLFALRFAEPNLLVSSEIGGESRIIFYRDIMERVRKIAPFLSYDGDPYPIVIDGGVRWIVDAYTTSSFFPYAQRANASAVQRGDLRQQLNYVRNSIKVEIDAYDGTMKFWIIDPDDPIAQSYRKQFPDLFEDGQPEPEVAAHFRYPEDLFRIQTDMWGRYRISDPAEFYDAAGAWSVAQDPGNTVGVTVQEIETDATGQVIRRSEARIPPQYLLLRLPDEEAEDFVLFRPFVPFSEDDSRKNLEGFMIAHNDPDRYGEIEVYEIRSDQPVDGPALFNSNIQTETSISERITLLNQSGSQVRSGNLLMMPVGSSLLYVRPLFVEATGTTAVPELQLVIVGVGPEVVIAETFDDALESVVDDLDINLNSGTASAVVDGDEADEPSDVLDELLPGDEPDEPDASDAEPDDTPPDDGSLASLLAAAQAAFDRADAALRRGDLAGYQDAVSDAERLLRRAAQLVESTDANRNARASLDNLIGRVSLASSLMSDG